MSSAATLTMTPAAGPQHPNISGIAACSSGESQAVEHVERQHDVDRGVRKGQVGDAALRQPRQTALVREPEAAPGQLEAERRAVFLEKRKVCAGAAAGIEQPGLRSSGRGLIEERCDEPPKPRNQKCRCSARKSVRATLHGAAF